MNLLRRTPSPAESASKVVHFKTNFHQILGSLTSHLSVRVLPRCSHFSETITPIQLASIRANSPHASQTSTLFASPQGGGLFRNALQGDSHEFRHEKPRPGPRSPPGSPLQDSPGNSSTPSPKNPIKSFFFRIGAQRHKIKRSGSQIVQFRGLYFGESRRISAR